MSSLSEKPQIISPDIYPDSANVSQKEYRQETHLFSDIAKIAGAEIEYTFEIPRHQTDTVPLVIVPGFGGIKPAYSEFRREIADLGKPAVTFRPARTQKNLIGYHPRHLLHPERLLAQSCYAVMRELSEIYGYEKFDLSGHSTGGRAVVSAANKKPDLVRTVILLASAGLDPHNLFVLASRCPDFIIKDLVPSFSELKIRHDRNTAIDGLKYFLSNPIRTLGEGIAVAQCGTQGGIKEQVIRLGRLGVKTAALQFKDDQFFPLNEVTRHSAGSVDHYEVFSDPKAGHLTPQCRPKEVADSHMNILRILHNSVPRLELVQ